MRATSMTGRRSVSGSKVVAFAMYGLVTKTLSGASNQVYPSGELLATASEPMFWLPPVRFSTTTGCFHVSCRCDARVRAIVSGEPPGGSGTTIRSGRSGYWAAAQHDASASAAPISQRFTFPPVCGRRQFTYSAARHTIAALLISRKRSRN